MFKKIALGLITALVLNVAVSTVWFNQFDPGLQKIRNEFKDDKVRVTSLSCGDMPQDEYGRIEKASTASCTGGPLEKRDRYLATHKVKGWGQWESSNSWPRYNTFQFYFRYWF